MSFIKGLFILTICHYSIFDGKAILQGNTKNAKSETVFADSYGFVRTTV